MFLWLKFVGIHWRGNVDSITGSNVIKSRYQKQLTGRTHSILEKQVVSAATKATYGHINETSQVDKKVRDQA